MRRLPLLCCLLLSPTAWAAGSADCEEHRERVEFIMEARLDGVPRQELTADLAGGGPPPPNVIRLITDVYELPIGDLRGDARDDRLDEFRARCVRDG